jgi:hypothetical protein
MPRPWPARDASTATMTAAGPMASAAVTAMPRATLGLFPVGQAGPVMVRRPAA